MKVLATIRDVIRMTFEHEELVTLAAYGEIVRAITDAEWVFDKKVHEHLAKKLLSCTTNVQELRGRLDK
jgi:hypothetical protein